MPSSEQLSELVPTETIVQCICKYQLSNIRLRTETWYRLRYTCCPLHTPAVHPPPPPGSVTADSHPLTVTAHGRRTERGDRSANIWTIYGGLIWVPSVAEMDSGQTLPSHAPGSHVRPAVDVDRYRWSALVDAICSQQEYYYDIQSTTSLLKIKINRSSS